MRIGLAVLLSSDTMNLVTKHVPSAKVVFQVAPMRTMAAYVSSRALNQFKVREPSAVRGRVSSRDRNHKTAANLCSSEDIVGVAACHRQPEGLLGGTIGAGSQCSRNSPGGAHEGDVRPMGRSD